MELTLDQALSKGIEAYKAGQLKEADRFFTAILQAHPKHPDANHNMGVLAVGVGKIQEALPFFETAIETNKSVAQYWLSYIDALLTLNKISHAKTAFEQAKQNGADGELFGRLANRLDELDRNIKDVEIEGNKIKQAASNILDALTLDQATKFARKKLKSGLTEEARSIYRDILVRFPKNKKATNGIKALSSGNLRTKAILQEPRHDLLVALMVLFNQGQLEEALEQVSVLIKQFPSSVILYNIRGASHAKLRQFDAAIEGFQQALKIKPDFFDAYNNIGNALIEQGELDKAINSYKQALSFKPNFAEAHHNMGIAFKAKGELDTAIESFKQALKVKPDYPEACIKLGSLLHKKGELEEAISCYKQALNIRPDFVEAHYNLGIILKDKGDLDPAIDSYNEALRIKPSFAEAHYNKGIALRDKGDLSAAITSFTNSLEVKPDYLEAYNNIGNIQKDTGELDAAIDNFKHALKIKPTFVEAYVNMGNALKDKGDLDAAIDSYKQAIKIKPDFVECYYNLGNALRDKGELNAAATSYEQALKNRPSFAEAHCNLGNIWNEKGELDAAIDCYKHALKYKPDYAEAYNNMGLTLKDMGELDAAIESLKQAIKINPDFEDAYSNLGHTLKGVAFSRPIPDLIEIILDLLNRQYYVRPIDVSRAGISLLKFVPEIDQLLKNSSLENSKQFLDQSLLAIAEAPLLLQLMSICPLADIELEVLLTKIRSSLLSFVSTISASPKLLRFQSALALQCFTNEYLYSQTDIETNELEAFEFLIAQTLANGQQPTAQALLCLASYKALHHYEWAGSLDVTPDILEVFTRQFSEPNQEKQIKLEIPILEEIKDKISSKVRQQYEENPFPRWVNLGFPLRPVDISKKVDELKLRLFDGAIADVKSPSILVAGCGTGQHSIGTAATFRDSRVLAIDLSLASLAYAKRKTEKLGIQNIDYMQADILDLGKLERQFDIVESAGVLHHMAEPIAGWKVLTNCLKPGGLMKIGLYSELARKNIIAMREEIRQSDMGSSDADMKSFRCSVMKSDGDHHKWALNSGDFYSMSELRDLIFHVQEHRFTVPQIKESLNRLGLKFCGFEAGRIIQDFKSVNTGLDDPYDLDKWRLYEEANPNTFVGMYQFWCQKL